MQLRLKNEADCLDLQHTELRCGPLRTPCAGSEPLTARAVSFVDPERSLERGFTCGRLWLKIRPWNRDNLRSITGRQIG